MHFYKITYTASINRVAVFKLIKSHTAQDANFLFKTFHEGRIRNTKLVEFVCVTPAYVKNLIDCGVVEKVSTNVYKGTIANENEKKPVPVTSHPPIDAPDLAPPYRCPCR